MFLNITGTLIHEILGLILFILVLLHVYLNRKLLFGISKKLGDPKINSLTKVKCILDWLMIILVFASIITGILASRDLFYFINAYTRRLHIYLSVATLGLILVHFSLNLKLFYNTLKIKNNKYLVIFTIIIFILLFSFVFYQDIINQSGRGQNNRGNYINKNIGKNYKHNYINL